MSARLRIGVGGHDEPVVACDFFGIDEAIDLSRSTKRPSFLAGPHVYQELRSWRRRADGYGYGGRSIVDENAAEIFDYAKPYFRGRSGVLSKVAGFLTVRQHEGVVDIDKLINGRDGVAPFQNIQNEIIEEFVSTRKKKDGAASEIEECLHILENISPPGPYIITLRDAEFNLEQYLCVRAWSRSPVRPPLVFALDDSSALATGSADVVRTSPIHQSELFDFLKSECGPRALDIERKYKTWIASKSPLYSRIAASDHFIDLYDASAFLQFLNNLPEDEEPTLGGTMLPRVAAPIMFREEEQGVGLDHTLATGVRPSHLAGAARALRNQAADLAGLPTLDNAVPRATVLLGRIAVVLERISTSRGEAEEADLIEFGVEFSALEGRVYEAGERLGTLSRGETLSFIGEGARFLNRFDIWKKYREEAGDVPEAADAGVTSTAIEILRAAVSEGVLTAEAAGRVTSALDSVGESDGAVRREGLARSTENLGAALGRGALKAAKAGTLELGDELRKRGVEAAADTSERFVRKHAGQFLALAAARSGTWLSMMVSHFLDQ